ncbi:hypothetical protein [Nonomuraea sp. NPDC049129]|uniref:hypothetical protein n=1 Tax=Nonomuraea sp. NPDC049129 TaxID=3155272 RepID=UPI0033F269E9
MSNTSVFDNRIAYRPAVVDLFHAAVDPEIKLASDEIAELQGQVNQLQVRIADRKQHIAELRQALSDVVASADLPITGLPPQPQPCRSCDQPIVTVADGTWTHAGRELLEKGHLCTPEDRNSPVAEPVKGPGQAFGDWNEAIEQQRSEGRRP